MSGDVKERGRVLVVDDDASTREVLGEALSLRRFVVRTAPSGEAAEANLAEGDEVDVILTDLRMGRVSGFDLVESARRVRPDIPVVVLTAFGSIELAVDAVKRGAFDFLTKPFDLEVVTLALDRAVRHALLTRELDSLRGLVTESSTLISRSTAMHAVMNLLARVAPSDATVLVRGESGTGKELVARALHDRSARASGPFVAINCAALPEPLLESELFGHARGSFTDAKSARPGLFVSAHGGTLFLDEIGEMPLAMQAKLLRALEDRTVRPVGADRSVPFDVRIVAATHRDLDADVEAGRFRQDLFFRLQVVDLTLPPLRARGSDVLLLATHFLRAAARRYGRGELTLGPDVAQALLRYDWPGNVRELSNTIERAVALARQNTLAVDDLPERVQKRAAEPRRVLLSVDSPDDLVPLEEVERRYVLRVIEAVDGNKKLAAQILGLDRSTLYRKIGRWT